MNTPSKPYIGRESIFARVQQHLIDPQDRHAFGFTGQAGVGKSALLQNMPHFLDEDLLCIYVPLSQYRIQNEDEWLLHLVALTDAFLANKDFTLLRLPNWDKREEDLKALSTREWLRDHYLEIVLQIIRPHRRLVWLIDDAEALINARTNGILPADHIEFLHSLLLQHNHLGMLITISIEFEHFFDQLMPLLIPTATERIQRLNQDETNRLLQEFVPTISDEHCATIYRATGGYPKLLERYGIHLNTLSGSLNTDTLKQFTRTIYQQSQAEFEALWKQLGQDERLTLTAISSLLFNDPQRAIRAEDIQHWLVETDYPLDTVAILASLRSLEYRELLTTTRDNIRVNMGLFQTWLMEHARIEQNQGEHRSLRLNRRLVGILIGASLLILLLLIAISQIPAPLVDDAGNIVATVTLESNS